MKTIFQKLKAMPPRSRAIVFYLVYYGALGAFVPYYNLALNLRGISGTQLGIFAAINSVIILILTPMISNYADRKHKRVLILAAAFFVNALANGLLTFPQTFFALLPIIIVESISRGPGMPISSAIIVRMANKSNIGYGSLRMWGSVGFTVFSFITGFLWKAIGYDWLFVCMMIMLLFAGIITFLLDEPSEELSTEDQLLEQATRPAANQSKPALFNDWAMILFLIAAFLNFSAMTTYFNFAGIYMTQLGGAASDIGIMRAASGLIEIPSIFIANRLLQKRRQNAFVLLLTSITIMTITWYLFSIATLPIHLLIFTAFRGIGFGFYTTASVVFIDSRSTEELACTYQSSLGALTMGLAPLVAAPLAGYLFDKIGAAQTFNYSSVVGLVAILMMIPVGVLLKRKETPVVALSES